MNEDHPAAGPPEFGDPAPRFTARTDGSDRYSLEVAAGRWMLLFAFGTLGHDVCRRAHDLVLERRERFNDEDAVFYGVSVDPRDRTERGLASAAVGVRYFWDFDRAVSRRLGIVDGGFLRPWILLIDPGFRIAFSAPVEEMPAALERLDAALTGAPGAQATAPVLVLPRVLEPEACRELIDYFTARTPTPSGFSADVAGRTVQLLNPLLKRRHDVLVEDEPLRAGLEEKLRRRLFPQIETAFGWRATHIERFLIARYGAEDQGFFSAHRDNVTAGTAHRKFAVSLNLNAGEHEGGDLRFPEFGSRGYRPETGGAAVFSCSLLHEATPVTRGVRYVFVPFLYDAEGARVRAENLAKVSFEEHA